MLCWKDKNKRRRSQKRSCCLDRLFAAWFPSECVISASLEALLVAGRYSSTNEMASFHASSHARGSRCLQRDIGVISLSLSLSFSSDSTRLNSTTPPPVRRALRPPLPVPQRRAGKSGVTRSLVVLLLRGRIQSHPPEGDGVASRSRVTHRSFLPAIWCNEDSRVSVSPAPGDRRWSSHGLVSWHQTLHYFSA